jgi:hypothetical protein
LIISAFEGFLIEAAPSITLRAKQMLEFADNFENLRLSFAFHQRRESFASLKWTPRAWSGFPSNRLQSLRAPLNL